MCGFEAILLRHRDARGLEIAFTSLIVPGTHARLARPRPFGTDTRNIAARQTRTFLQCPLARDLFVPVRPTAFIKQLL